MTPYKIIAADSHMCEPPNRWNDISWALSFLERADKYHRRWQQAYEVSIFLKPSDYFRRQIYFAFIDDSIGLQTYQLANCTDNILWSTDYPHQAATWPHSQEVIERNFRTAPEADKRKIVRDNAAKLYGFSVE